MALVRTYVSGPQVGRDRGLARLAGRFFEGRAYAGLQRFADVVGLNILWVVASLPVVTFFPATAAMFAVTRKWDRGDEPPLARTFGRAFRENFRQAMTLQAVWMLVGLGLVANIQLGGVLPPAPRLVLQGGLWVAALALAVASVWVFPLMVHYRTRWTGLLRWSLLLGIGRPATTICCLLVVAPTVAVSAVFPPLPLLAGSVVAVTVYRWCRRVFDDIATGAEPAVGTASV